MTNQWCAINGPNHYSIPLRKHSIKLFTATEKKQKRRIKWMMKNIYKNDTSRTSGGRGMGTGSSIHILRQQQQQQRNDVFTKFDSFLCCCRQPVELVFDKFSYVNLVRCDARRMSDTAINGWWAHCVKSNVIHPSQFLERRLIAVHVFSRS